MAIEYFVSFEEKKAEKFFRVIDLFDDVEVVDIEHGKYYSEAILASKGGYDSINKIGAIMKML